MSRSAAGRGGVANEAPALEPSRCLPSWQNIDGGWPFLPGRASWTEPTVLALLALRDEKVHRPAVERGFDWLARCRRRDGGWPPTPGVDEPSWVTALAALLLAQAGRLNAGDPAIHWLLSQQGAETTLANRVRQWMQGVKSRYRDAAPGWPWISGTAGWVVPTAFSILALRKAQARFPDATISARIEEGRRFLIARRCKDLGWNHGDSQSLGFYSVSFPETTGLALLALQGGSVPEISGSIERAKAHARGCRSTQGRCWLRLGLMAQGAGAAVVPEGYPLGWPRTVDAALVLLCGQAIAGNNVFGN